MIKAPRQAISDLDRRGLRNFGLVTGVAVAALFGVLFPWALARTFPLWPWVILAVLSGWALIAPDTLQPVYRGWMKFGLLLSKITTPVIMTSIFFLIITPVGLVMRMAKRDPMRRRLEVDLDSYRVESQQPCKENLEKPF